MKAFEALLIPTGVIGRSGMSMLSPTVELLDTRLPLALKWQKADLPSHEGGFTVGAIEAVELRPDGVWGVGTMLDSPETSEAEQQITAGITQPSVELVIRSETMTDATGTPVTPETAESMMLDGAQVVMRMDAVEIVAATLVSVPEFRSTSITLTDADETRQVPTLVAAAVVVEDTYDPALFDNPQLDEPVPIHVTDDGRVVGYLSTRDTCHVGYKNRCVEPPRSKSGYAYFHQSSVKLTNGERLPVGRLTIGGGHARPGVGIAAAVEHYDNVGTCWAKVRAGDDEIGTWVAGVVDPDAPSEMVRKALGTPHSGHWEPVGGNPELIAACGVNAPGFPIVQRVRNSAGELAMVASLAPRQSRPVYDTSILDDVAARAVRAYTEQQAADARAEQARGVVAAMSARRRVVADAIRESHTRRKAS